MKNQTNATHLADANDSNMEQKIEYYQKIGIDEANFTIDATGDCCVGDCILFEEAVFEGEYPNSIFKGTRKIFALILKDSYGEKKQQHTFTILLLKAEGTDADRLNIGQKILRKGRNVYKNGTKRMPWQDENERAFFLEEKHSRGAEARREAEERKREREERKREREEARREAEERRVEEYIEYYGL